jgi:HSP20 family protein
MANTRNKGEQESQSAQGEHQGREGQHQRQLQRSQSSSERMTPHRGAAPFQWMRQMTEDMDRMFDRFFGDVGFPRRAFGTDLSRGEGRMTWRPKVEAYQKDDKFIVRAELPGVSRDDVTVDISDDALTIRGERKHEQEEEREGFYHSEWSYGSFARTIPLPDGAIADNADASFRDGVLKITIPAPPSGVRQGRRIEIQEERENG